MPGYIQPGLAAATVVQFADCRLQYTLSQKLTPTFVFPGGNKHLFFRSTGVIILSSKKMPQPLNHLVT
jgi:hypothetical protein